MKLFCAVDSFKGSLSSKKIRQITEKQLKLRQKSGVDVCFDCVAVGDGGEGTAEAFTDGLVRRTVRVPVTAKTGRKKVAKMLLCEGKIYIDCCEACGISAENRKDDALISFTTYGLGELILAAMREEEISEVVVGLGGSGTTDGGAGLLAALGAKFYDRMGREVGYLPSEIDRVAKIDLTPAKEKITKKLTVLCDTEAPLLGENGCVALFSAQKGATAAGKRYLERTLGIFATAAQRAITALNGDIPQSTDMTALPSGGAAGGLGFALIYLLGGTRKNGLSTLFEARGYEARLAESDAVLSGEGLLDGTSFTGKAVGRIADLCEKHQKPLHLICGDVEPFLPLPSTVANVYKLTDLNPSTAECLCRAEEFFTRQLNALLDAILPSAPAEKEETTSFPLAEKEGDQNENAL